MDTSTLKSFKAKTAIQKQQFFNSLSSVLLQESQILQIQKQASLKVNAIKYIFTLSQQEIVKYFNKYEPFSFSQINLKNVAQTGGVRIIKDKTRIYLGNTTQGKRHGKGVLVDENGKIYEGGFVDNERSGYGVQVYPNGNVYIGGFSANKKHGKGKLIWFNLTKQSQSDQKQFEYYVGDWWGGLPDGKGLHHTSSSNIYLGEFKNGLKHGKGKELLPSQTFYSGSFVNGLQEGYGTYLLQSGQSYTGDFKQGQKHGKGVWRNAYWTEWYDGSYKNNKKCGYGEYRWPNGNTYKGEFEDDQPHGQGQYYQIKSQEMKGTWQKGIFVVEPAQNQKILEDTTYPTRNSVQFEFMHNPESKFVRNTLASQYHGLNQYRFPSQFSEILPNPRPLSSKATKFRKRVMSQKTLHKKSKQKQVPQLRPISGAGKTQYFQQEQHGTSKCKKPNCGCNQATKHKKEFIFRSTSMSKFSASNQPKFKISKNIVRMM